MLPFKQTKPFRAHKSSKAVGYLLVPKHDTKINARNAPSDNKSEHSNLKGNKVDSRVNPPYLKSTSGKKKTDNVSLDQISSNFVDDLSCFPESLIETTFSEPNERKKGSNGNDQNKEINQVFDKSDYSTKREAEKEKELSYCVAKDNNGKNLIPVSRQEDLSVERISAATPSQNNEVNLSKKEVECSLDSWDLPESVLLQYKRRGVSSMFKWQAECLTQGKALEGGNLVYSAPTSAGKTLVAEILVLKNVLENKRKALIILPFVSVAREKMTFLQGLFQNAGVRVDGYMGSHNPAGGLHSVDVAVCTIEKANGLVNRLLEEGKLNSLGIIVVDEIHMLGDPHRGYLLELLLTKVLYMSRKEKDNEVNIQIVGMSATLPNLTTLSDWLNASLYRTDFRPIPLMEYCKIGNSLYDSKTMEVTRQMKDVLKLPGISDQDHSIQLAVETVVANHSVLVFCPSKQWCEQLAVAVARTVYELGRTRSPQEPTLSTMEQNLGVSLCNILQETLLADVMEQLRRCPAGLDKQLAKTIAFGVAFHHAGLTMYERDIVEAAFRQGSIKVLVATTTLSSGVNLPARRVIIRSAFMCGSLLDVLSYKQMVGRAGRMGADTEGESILICKENERNQVMKLISSQLSPVQSCLVRPGEKSLSSSLKRALLEIVASGVASSPSDIELYASCTLLAASLRQEEGDANKSTTIEACIFYLVENEFIDLVETEKDGVVSSKYVATQLGRAVLASSLTPDEGLNVLKELGKAQKCFVLDNELHLVYQVTPPYLSTQMSTLNWLHYLSLWSNLPESFRLVGELVGVEDRFLNRAVHCPPAGTSARQAESLRIHQRFYAALALHDLVQERPLVEVASKYALPKGLLQSLQQSASTFAGMVTAFCNRLGWRSLELLISQFQSRLHFGIQQELCELVTLHTVDGQRARALYNAGYETVALLAATEPKDVEIALKNAVPFSSTKNTTDGENTRSARSVFIAGYGSMTQIEAAQLIVKEAKYRFQSNLGLKSVQWQEKDKDSEVITQDKNAEHPEATAAISKSSFDNTAVHHVTSCHKEEDKVEKSTPNLEQSIEENCKSSSNVLPNNSPNNPKSSVKVSTSTPKNVYNKSPSGNFENDESADPRVLGRVCINKSSVCKVVKQTEGSCPIKEHLAASVTKIQESFRSIEIPRTSPKDDNFTIKDMPTISVTHSPSEMEKTRDETIKTDAKQSDSLTESQMVAMFQESSDLLACSVNPECQGNTTHVPNSRKTDDPVIIPCSESFAEENSEIIHLSDSIDFDALCRKRKSSGVCRLQLSVKTFSRMMSCIESKVKPGTSISSSSILRSMKEFSESQSLLLQEKQNNNKVSMTSNELNENCSKNKVSDKIISPRALNVGLDSKQMENNKSPNSSTFIFELPNSEDLFPDSEINVSVNQDRTPNKSSVSVELFSSPIESANTSAQDPCLGNDELLKNRKTSLTVLKLGGHKNSDNPILGDVSMDLNAAGYFNSPFILTGETPKMSSPTLLLSSSSTPTSALPEHHKFPPLSPVENNSQILPRVSSIKITKRNSSRSSISSELSDSAILAMNDITASNLSSFPTQGANIDTSILTTNTCSQITMTGSAKRKHITNTNKNKDDDSIISPSPPKRIGNSVLFQNWSVAQSTFNESKFTQLRTRSNKENVSPSLLEAEIEPSNGGFCIIDVTADKSLFEVFLEELTTKDFVAISLACMKKESALQNVKSIGSSVKSGAKVCKQTIATKDSNIYVNDTHVVGMSFCWEDRDSYFVSLMPNDPTDQNCMTNSLVEPPIDNTLPLETRLEAVQGFFKNFQTRKVVCFDLKHQWHLLSKGCRVESGPQSVQWLDPKMADWLLNASEKEKTLHSLTINHAPHLLSLLNDIGRTTGARSIGISSGKKSSGRIRAATESVIALHVMRELLQRLKELDVDKHFLDVEMPAVVLFCQMEENGFGFNQQLASNMQERLQAHQLSLEAKAHGLAGRKFSPSSHIEVSKVFRELRLISNSTKNKQTSTSKEALEKLRDKHPLPEIILEWRRISSSQTKVLLPLLRESQFCPSVSMHRIFGEVFMMATTGRISMREPSLLTIPREYSVSADVEATGSPESTVNLRKLFLPFEGAVLLSADYSQLELRILAYLSGDPNLLSSLNSGLDVFSSIASKWLQIAVEKVTTEQRQKAKRMSYGIIYGIGKKALADQLNVEEHEAMKFMDDFQAVYCGIRKYMDRVMDSCRVQGYVTTMFGRRRYLPNITSANGVQRAAAERQAVNTCIQGSASDLVKMAMLKIQEKVQHKFPSCSKTHQTSDKAAKTGAYFVLQLHDELIYEVPFGSLKSVAKILKNNMESIAPSGLSLPVNLKAGPSWGQLSELIP